MTTKKELDARLELIKAGVEAGMRNKDIAKETGIPLGTVAYHAWKIRGGERGARKETKQRVQRGYLAERNAVVVNMHAQGYTYPEIKEATGVGLGNIAYIVGRHKKQERQMDNPPPSSPAIPLPIKRHWLTRLRARVAYWLLPK